MDAVILFAVTTLGGVPCAQLYGSLAPSRSFVPVSPYDSTVDNARSAMRNGT
jgi:hypothetical protein